MLNERGVSEIIGAILLVSLVVLGVMIVAVLLLSQPPPQEIPQVNAIAGNNTSYIFLRHDGGDPLKSFETIIRIDGKPDPVPAGDITLIDENGNSITPWTSGEWSVGSTLVIKDNETPKSVSLTYTGGSSQALLVTATFVDTIPSVIPTLPPGFYHIITTSAGAGGSISPPGPVQVPDGGSQTFSITPNQCYRITGVLVDGSPVGAVASYTFTNVRSDHTISATFAENTLAITASAGTGGTITPSGTVPASCGGSQVFTIINNSGYWILDVLVDGSSVGAVPSYTFNNIVVNHTITATFTNVAPTTPTTAPTTSPTPTPTPACGTISGYKWNDLNGNGIWDTGEPGLSGWTIQIYEKSGNNWIFVTSVTTGTGGYYIATGLLYHPANQYLVKEIVQSGWQRTYPVNEDYYNFIVLNQPHCYETGINFGNRQVLPPVADFIGTPTSGYAPLTVQFTDQSTGNPTQWAWDVNNDGITDYTTQNPSHTYLSPGTYTVKLTATNAGGSSTKIKTGYITVNAPLSVSIYLNADKEGLLHSGDYVQFRVIGQNSFIKHGNSYYGLSLNDIVKIELTSDVKGSIYATSTYISDFRFNNVKLYINGDDKGTKDIGTGDIWISSYDSYASTLSIIVPADNEWTHFQVNNPPPIIYGDDNRVIQVFNLQPGPFGLMNLDNRNDIFYNGGATGYSIT